MKWVNNYLKSKNLKALKYEIRGKAVIVKTDNGTLVLKAKDRSSNDNIFSYLNSRNFNYYPKIIDDDNFYVTEYQKDTKMPLEQKMNDLVDLVSLLHSKTTYYKEIDIDDYKKIYEDINNNILHLRTYYNDLMTIIEAKTFMSPSEYLLARNISKIFGALNFCDGELKNWEKIMKDKKKQRFVVLHNNLDINHFIRNKRSYLISWDKARIDIPIFDLYKLYKKYGLDYEFESILKNYERSYPLLEEEKILLYVLISLPDKIEFNDSEYVMCQKISHLIDLLYKTEQVISPYYAKKS